MKTTIPKLRRIIRNVISESMTDPAFNEMHADKLAKLIGSGNLESINQALELGVHIDMISNHWRSDPLDYRSIPEKIIFFHVVCHRGLAAKIRQEIKSNRSRGSLFGFIGCEPGGTTVEYDDMPEFCKISFRLRSRV